MKRSYFYSLALVVIITAGTTLNAQDNTPKLNQVGYYPDGPKVAIIPESDAGTFTIVNSMSANAEYTGTLSEALDNEVSGETVRVADFSDFTTPGRYTLKLEDGTTSYEFEIKDQILRDAADGALKAYYFMRASTPLEEQYAGPWARPAGHPDTDVMIHASAATESRPEGVLISSPKGWYDAGDYNKYVVNSGISTYTLLFSYERFPQFFNNQSVNIPESGNEMPDILDEALWNLRWLLTMQDPEDGGVYHKLTTANFEGELMPHEATNQRYVVMKNTPATLDFVAMMAQAARVYRPFLPQFADSAITAARKAWGWAEENQDIYYRQGQMNQQYDPDVVTGAYGDWNNTDEWFWAGTEMYITTGDVSFYDPDGWKDEDFTVPGWNNVRALGLYSLIHHMDKMDELNEDSKQQLKEKLFAMIDEEVEASPNAAYRSPFGYDAGHFFWGSIGHAGNMAMAILLAYELTEDQKYYDAALHVADYLLGRNPTGYSYITGFGDKPIMNIHHRPSQADGIVDPVPGLVSGGPNPNNMNQDCGEDKYPSKLPALAFLDDWCSYSSNEITINWNAPWVYVFSGLEYLKP